MGKSNTELLKIAQKHLGEGGSKFRRFCGLPAGAAWCNAFVDYVANEGGDSSLYFNGKKYTYCPDSIKWCYNNLADIPIYLALPMDIIYFDWEPNGRPNHIGFVRGRHTDQDVYTIEGNTSGGVVAQRTRPLYGKRKDGTKVKYIQAVFRPHFKGSWKDAPLEIDGYFGYNSIAMLRKALGMSPSSLLSRAVVLELQKLVGVKQDGSWGVKTSKAVQKMVGTTVDGAFGVKSVKALQKWINKVNGYSNPKKKTEPKKSTPKPKAEPTQGDKIAESAKSYIGKVKYVKGGKSLKTGCDCTGFVQAIHKLHGINLKVSEPWGKSVGKSTSKAKPGDVIYYNMNGELHHMGIYVGDGKVVHNSTSHKDWTKDVCKSDVKMPGMTIGDIRRCWK